MEKIDGYVKTWNADKGFGFIELKGEPVKLVVVQGVRGPQAAAVEVWSSEEN